MRWIVLVLMYQPFGEDLVATGQNHIIGMILDVLSGWEMVVLVVNVNEQYNCCNWTW
jgi:hypothetical protein